MKRRTSLLLSAAVLLLLGLASISNGLGLSTVRTRPSLAQSAPIGPLQDTFVVLGLNTPNGHLGDLTAGWKVVDYYGLLQFEIPDDLGPDATIVKARMEFYCRESDLERTGGNALIFNQANRRWDEGRVTWQTKPGLTGPTFQWDPGRCDKPLGADGVWKVLSSDDVPELLNVINGWYNGRYDNNGFVISSNAGAKQLWTFTAQGSNSPPVFLGKQPRLYLEFANAVTATFTPSITPTPTETPIPSDTPIATETPTPTDTPEPSPTATATPTPTDTPTPTETPEPEGIYLPFALREAEIRPAQTPEPPPGDRARP